MQNSSLLPLYFFQGSNMCWDTRRSTGSKTIDEQNRDNEGAVVLLSGWSRYFISGVAVTCFHVVNLYSHHRLAGPPYSFIATESNRRLIRRSVQAGQSILGLPLGSCIFLHLESTPAPSPTMIVP